MCFLLVAIFFKRKINIFVYVTDFWACYKNLIGMGNCCKAVTAICTSLSFVSYLLLAHLLYIGFMSMTISVPRIEGLSAGDNFKRKAWSVDKFQCVQLQEKQ